MSKLNLEPCLPPLWAGTGHTQTLLGHLLPSKTLRSLGERYEIKVNGGDKLVARFLSGPSLTVVYFFHGLGGTADAAYMQRSAEVAQRLGHSVFLVNHRGCGEGVGLAKEPYHSGRSEDLSSVIAFGRKKFPNHKHLAVGFSLSGNALLLLLTGRRGDVKPDFAISVNAPINLESASIALTQGLNKIYDLRFFLECRKAVYLRHTKGEADKFQIPKLTTLREFDSFYTGPASGFRDREDYYASCSTYNLLDSINTPTIVLTAKDDPFVLYEHYENAKYSPDVIFHAESCGGHMGYLSRKITPLGTNRWQDYALSEAMKLFL